MNYFGADSPVFPMVAKTAMGLEDVLAEELLRLGADDVRVLKRAVAFKGNQKLLYRANFNLRTAFRVLRTLLEFNYKREQDVYERVRDIKWEEWLDSQKTFVVEATGKSPVFRNTMYLAQRVKDGIADRFRQETGYRPSVDKENPDLRVHITVSGTRAVVSLDSSGESLHKRGYRRHQGRAVLNEVLAAGMILKSGWHGEKHFVDPMCGSGTLPIEAALYALGIPPAFLRNKFGFLSWKNFDATLYQNVRNFSPVRTKLPVRIIGADKSAVAIRQARFNVENAGLTSNIHLEISDFRDLTPPSGPGTVMVDPPYGRRMKVTDLRKMYQDFFSVMNSGFSGYEGWMITSGYKLLNGMAFTNRGMYALNHGGLDVRVVRFSPAGVKGAGKGDPGLPRKKRPRIRPGRKPH